MDTSRNAHARLKKLEKLLYYAELAQVWRAGRDLARGFGIIFEGQLFAGDPRDLVAETGYAVSLEEIAAALEMELRELKARILQWAASFGFYVYGVEVRLNRVTTSAFLKGLLHELAEIPAEAHPTGTLTDGESRARLKKLKEVLLAAERRHRPIWKRQVGNDHLLDVLKISGKKNILDFHSFPVSLGEIAAALEVGEGELSGRISRVARPGFHFPSFQLAELGFPLVGGNVWMTPEVSGEFLSNLLYELAPSGEISHAGNLGESL
ncbi:MAG TPA: hypothetical protein VKK79_10945, partial [Candidatus Lokiarchaeia archaeon]|nr:hypothetical protein [Candidatus Lokiarchaeia archaeon]